MTIHLADGRVLDTAIRPEASGEPIQVTVIEEIQGRVFDSCPVCGAPATDDEHARPGC